MFTDGVLRDPDNRFSHVFSTMGVPESLLISRDGTILHHWRGPLDTMPNDVEPIVENALAFGQKGQPLPQPDLQNGVRTIGLTVTFFAGLLSFLLPCVLPLIPSYAAFITGMTLDELTLTDQNRSLQPVPTTTVTTTTNKPYQSSSSHIKSRRLNININHTVFLRSLLFVVGFSLIFISLGASITFVGSIFRDYSLWIARIGGIILVIFGLYLFRILRIPGMERERGFRVSKKPVGHIGAFVVGMGFGAG